MKANILITGPPASGKSTLVRELIAGKNVGGVFTPEIRRDGDRWGFKVIDAHTGREAVFASVEIKPAVISKYGLDLDAFDKVVVPALEWAIANSDLIVIDEIGVMEIRSDKFRLLVEQALETKKVIATISFKSKDPFIEKIKARKDCKTHYLSKANYDRLLVELKREL